MINQFNFTSFFNKSILGIISDFRIFYLFISFMLIFDSSLLHQYNIGILEINILEYFNKIMLFVIIIFGIIYNGLSPLMYSLVHKYLTSRWYKNRKNYKHYFDLKLLAIKNKDNFLYSYVNNEMVQIRNIKLNYKTNYTLLISLIINFLFERSILRETISLISKHDDILLRIFFGLLLLSVLLTIVSLFIMSIKHDEENIFFEEK